MRFASSRKRLSPSESSAGVRSAIVIWMGHSVFDPVPVLKAPELKKARPVETRPERLARQDSTPIGDLLQVEMEVPSEVNYSLLHNDRPLLGKLMLLGVYTFFYPVYWLSCMISFYLKRLTWKQRVVMNFEVIGFWSLVGLAYI